MGFLTLLEVASMPILQVLIVGMLGAFMATSYCNLLSAESRKSLNKIVFVVFTPSLIFVSLAKTVKMENIISWWFMPVNIALTFFFGGLLGWILVKILKPKPHLEGLIIATCSSGNLGNLLLIIVPAVCKEDGNPFGDSQVCSSVGLSYASFSMAFGGVFIWSYTYQLMRTSSVKYKALEGLEEVPKIPNKDSDADNETHLLQPQDQDHLDIIESSAKDIEADTENQPVIVAEEQKSTSFWKRLVEILAQIKEELLAPPTLGTILGLILGAVEWLRNLIIGDTAPLRVIGDSVQLLGDGTIPCITLILGGNLTQGLRASKMKPLVIIGVIGIRYIVLPAIGIWIVKLANHLGFLPPDPLFSYVLMVQFTLPPAMNIGTMTQLFDVAQEECSVLLMWTYLVGALALTFWCTIYMWNLS